MNHSPWTTREDGMLTNAIGSLDRPLRVFGAWRIIASKIPERSVEQCKKRWKILVKTWGDAVDEAIRERKRLDEEEREANRERERARKVEEERERKRLAEEMRVAKRARKVEEERQRERERKRARKRARKPSNLKTSNGQISALLDLVGAAKPLWDKEQRFPVKQLRKHLRRCFDKDLSSSNIRLVMLSLVCNKSLAHGEYCKDADNRKIIDLLYEYKRKYFEFSFRTRKTTAENMLSESDYLKKRKL
ncbi:hypothetical protein THAOC_18475 [Thalassiosira oceanica]|uniref:Myb-like domain-containing protein n=1 Tax=Thalassiosira oceanica TaxID=159749 RepID=K0S4P9_THAOC|nr:hypothetical protein THAOC_18475 [Thalassiosira oceanica]|eukprot:EJK61088.1 hypothetical protein THAOC_18475 [Thalassiosira oceanica]